MANRREVNMRKRKRRILEAAVELISQGGMDACTMRALAKQAQLDVTTLYNYYGSKEEILEALRRAGARRIRSQIEELPEMQPLERIQAIVEIWFGVVESPRELARPLNLVSPRGVPGEGPLQRTGQELLARELDRAQGEGLLLESVDSDLLAMAILQHARIWLPLWAERMVDANEVAARMDYALYLCLNAAATEASRSELMARLLASQHRLQALLTRVEEPLPLPATVR